MTATVSTVPQLETSNQLKREKTANPTVDSLFRNNSLASPEPLASTPVFGEKPNGYTFRHVSDPAEGKKLVRASRAEYLDKSYGPLFDQLGLTDEQREKFKEIRLDALEERETLLKKAFAADTAPHSREAAETILDVLNEQGASYYQDALRNEFGADITASVVSYEEMIKIHSITDEVANAFPITAPLSDQRKTQLSAILADHSRNAAGNVSLSSLDLDSTLRDAGQVLGSTDQLNMLRIAIMKRLKHSK